MSLRVCCEARHRGAKHINERRAEQIATMNRKVKNDKAKQHSRIRSKAKPRATTTSKANQSTSHTETKRRDEKAKQNTLEQSKSTYLTNQDKAKQRKLKHAIKKEKKLAAEA